MGYLNAKALVDVEDHKLVVWDCGAGSYQLTSSNLEFSDKFGSGTILKAAQEVFDNREQILPMSKEDLGLLVEYLD